jgi:hypothetical protein
VEKAKGKREGSQNENENFEKGRKQVGKQVKMREREEYRGREMEEKRK